MAKKRKLEEEVMSKVKKCGNAVVHSVVTDLSPIMNSKKDTNTKYFRGQISDGKECKGVKISFQPQVCDALCGFLERKRCGVFDELSGVGCQRRGYRDWKHVLSSTSKMESSPKKFPDAEAIIVVKSLQ